MVGGDVYSPVSHHLLAMTYMYEADRAFGIELTRKVIQEWAVRWGSMWDGTNSWFVNINEDNWRERAGPDYDMKMNLWGAPAVLAGPGLRAPCKPGG